MLIAVLLSAQATDVSVNKATAKLYPVANTPTAMLELGVEGVKTYIKTIGLYNSKAENIIKTCRILLEQHNGEVPEDHRPLYIANSRPVLGTSLGIFLLSYANAAMLAFMVYTSTSVLVYSSR